MLQRLNDQSFPFGIETVIVFCNHLYTLSLNDQSFPSGIANAEHNNTHEVLSWAFSFCKVLLPSSASNRFLSGYDHHFSRHSSLVFPSQN